MMCKRVCLVCVQAEEVDARILSAIIAGVRRAFPFVTTEHVQPLIEKHSDALFKMIHTAPFSVAVQALLLLHQLMAAQNAVSDRFYRYSLLHCRFKTCCQWKHSASGTCQSTLHPFECCCISSWPAQNAVSGRFCRYSLLHCRFQTCF